MTRFEQCLIRRESRSMPGRLGTERALESARNRMGDLILNGEDVGELAIVPFGPEVIAVFGVDQLRGDSDAASRATHAPFQDRPDPECFRNASNVLLLAAKRER